MMQVTEQCLVSNQGNHGPERIFQRITQSRANLAMVLVQRLTDASLGAKVIVELLETVWTTLNGIDNPFTPDQIQYWRTMLRMLYVVLRGYRTSPEAEGVDDDRIVAVLQCVLNILHRIVAQGFRSLVALIHDPVVTVLPEDLALLTAILQASLCLPGIDQVSGQVLNIMVSEDVGQAATSLLSWADKLAVKGDPVYGELSILFLVQLSNVPVIAEQLASDGLLGQLTSANIATHIQRPNVSPFADNVGAQRCYDIWAKGILPLLLNVLSAPGLGPNVATEVACILNQFPNLLQSSIDRIEAPGMSRTTARGNTQYVTLLGVSEVNSLALLTRVLGRYRSDFNREIPEISWDSATVLENVDYWLTSRKILRERLLPLGQREAEWRTMKTGVEDVSVLEQKVVSLLETVKEVLGDDTE
jgi:nuclear pore complex protein Nup188